MVPDARTSIILCGPPAVGKTTLGRLLASRLRIPFVDLDALVEAREKMSIEQIWRERGEGHFRKQETAALFDIKFRKGRPQVIALGGGTLQSEGNRAVVRTLGWLISLSADAEALLARGAASRSVVADHGIAHLLAERRETYAAVDHQLYNGSALDHPSTRMLIDELSRIASLATPA